MEAKHEFMVSNPKLTIEMCFDLLAVLGGGALNVYILFGIVKTIFHAFLSDHWLSEVAHLGIAIAMMGVIVIFLFTLIIVFFVKMIRFNYHLLSFTISVLDDGIEMTSKVGKYLIPISDILHIFKYESGFTLVWKHGDTPITFHIRNNHFGNKAIKEMAGLLSRFEGYTQAQSQIKRIRKNLKLDHIFRKNRYEYQLLKQRAEQKNFVC